MGVQHLLTATRQSYCRPESPGRRRFQTENMMTLLDPRVISFGQMCHGSRRLVLVLGHAIAMGDDGVDDDDDDRCRTRTPKLQSNPKRTRF